MKNSLSVCGTKVSVLTINEEDYICITDMVKQIENGLALVEKWLRNKNTIEFLGVWEQLNNIDFNSIEFERIKNSSGSNRFIISTRQWIERTNAIGIKAQAGRYGGTYAHKDIAFEFGSWVSPTFKLYLIREYQRVKAIENHPSLYEWNVKRILSKVNYVIHTDAVQDYVIPKHTKQKKAYVYASEADLLNLALWGCTAKQWKVANPNYAKQNLNLRDVASIVDLVVLSNLESMNAELIKQNIDKKTRFDTLSKIAQDQRTHLINANSENCFKAVEFMKTLKRINNELERLHHKYND